MPLRIWHRYLMLFNYYLFTLVTYLEFTTDMWNSFSFSYENSTRKEYLIEEIKFYAIR